ncbi:serine-rich coiled-coil domain-containing protein 1 [Lates japonicus]|uniref:Serine-rich coiled-coil domain-containing protein 1 n=1 Tax=Lates japonicus TaxID=270547 RepID=A0AAD3MHV1_LATJO|nr:serine-rich coiled-coil domain-containing protein 1 [Lates japonicus]
MTPGSLDDYSGGSNNNKRSSRQKKQLLPKSFSALHRFSRTSDHHRPPEVNLEPPSSTTITPGAGGLTPGSWPGELLGAGVDDLPAPSAGTGLAPGPVSVPGPATDTAPPDPPPAPENFSVAVSTSQVFFTPAQSSAEKPLLRDTSTANNTDYETAISLSEPETAVPCLPLREQSLEERKEREEERKEAREEVPAEERKELVEERKTGCRNHSESETRVIAQQGCSNPEQSEGGRNALAQEKEEASAALRTQVISQKPHPGMKKLMQKHEQVNPDFTF